MKPESIDAEHVPHRAMPELKPYAKPALIRYGEVRALTQGGSGGAVEADNGDGTCDMSKNKRSCLSDRRAKLNIAQVGVHPLGFGLYLFDYKPEHCREHGKTRQFGVMADEVRAFVPAAVTQDRNGLMTVDYEVLGIRRTAH